MHIWIVQITCPLRTVTVEVNAGECNDATGVMERSSVEACCAFLTRVEEFRDQVRSTEMWMPRNLKLDTRSTAAPLMQMGRWGCVHGSRPAWSPRWSPWSNVYYITVYTTICWSIFITFYTYSLVITSIHTFLYYFLLLLFTYVCTYLLLLWQFKCIRCGIKNIIF